MSVLAPNDVSVIGAGRLMEFLGDESVLKNVAADFGSERVKIHMKGDFKGASVTYVFCDPEQADAEAIAKQLREQVGGDIETSSARDNVNVTIQYD